MSRNLLPSALDYLANTNDVRIAHLVRQELSESTELLPVFTYLTDYANDIVWAGQTYEAGKITKVGDLRQTQGLTNYKLSIDVAGEFQEELDKGLVENLNKSYVGKEIEVLRAYLDEGANIIPFDKTTNGPMQYFIGDISDINITENIVSGNSTVKWDCAGKFQDFELVNGRVTDDASHRGLVSNLDGSTSPSNGAKREAYKLDTGFQHANQTINTVSEYMTNETRYRMKSSWLGFRTSTEEYQVEIKNTFELGLDLAAKFIPRVYGVRKIPGIPIFLDSLKDRPDVLYVVYALCEGEVDSILDIYLDGKSTICNDSNDNDGRVCTGTRRQGDTLSVFTTASGEADAIEADNSWVYGGALADIFGGSYAGGGLGGILDYANFPIEIVTPNKVTEGRTDGTTHEGFFTVNGDAGRYTVIAHHGLADQAANAKLVAEAAAGNFFGQEAWAQKTGRPPAEYWDANCKLLDTCYIVLEVAITENSTTIPEIDATVSGKLVSTYSDLGVETPRQYTLNPVWQMLDYMTDPVSGGSLASNLVDYKSFYDVAQVLDEVSTTYGDDFVSHWRYLGWKDAPGTNQVTVDGELHDVQKAFMQTNVVLRTETTVTKNVQSLLKQFDGTLNILGSKYHLSLEDNSTAIATIDASEIKGGIRTKDLSNKNKWNSIQAAITNPAQEWDSTQINFFNSEYLEADNGVNKKGNVVFSYITNYYTAREWAQVQLSKSRFSRELSMTTHYKYSNLFPNANVRVTYDRFSYLNKIFRVKSTSLQANGLVNITLEDFDPSIYISDDSDKEGEFSVAAPTLSMPKGLEFISLPSARFPGLTTQNFPDVNGFLLWDVSNSSSLLRYQVVDWQGTITEIGVPTSEVITDTNGLTKQFIGITNLEDSTDYLFKVRAISYKGSTSIYAQLRYTTTVVASPVYFSTVTSFKATNLEAPTSYIGNQLSVSWDTHIHPLATDYEIEIYEENGVTLLRLDSTTSNTYNYNITKNIADYAALNASAVGAYRAIRVRIRATNGLSGASLVVSNWTNLI